MDPAYVVTAPRFPSCWGLRCNEFVCSAAGQPPVRQAAAAPLRAATSEGLDNTSCVSEISPRPLVSPASSLRGEAQQPRGDGPVGPTGVAGGAGVLGSAPR